MEPVDQIQNILSLLVFTVALSLLLSFWKFMIIRDLRRLNRQATAELVIERSRIDAIEQRLNRLEEAMKNLSAQIEKVFTQGRRGAGGGILE